MTRTKLAAVGIAVAALMPIGGSQAYASGPSYATSLSQLIGPDGPPQGPNNTAAASATPEGTPALPVAAPGSEPVGVEFHPTTAPAGVNPLADDCYELASIHNNALTSPNNYIGNGAFGSLTEGSDYAGSDFFEECNYLGADYLSDNTVDPSGYVDFVNDNGVWVLNGAAASGHEDFFNGESAGGVLYPCWDDITGWDGAQHYVNISGTLFSEVQVGETSFYSDPYVGLKTGSPWSNTGVCVS